MNKDLFWSNSEPLLGASLERNRMSLANSLQGCHFPRRDALIEQSYDLTKKVKRISDPSVRMQMASRLGMVGVLLDPVAHLSDQAETASTDIRRYIDDEDGLPQVSGVTSELINLLKGADQWYLDSLNAGEAL